MATTKQKPLPKTLAGCADELYEVRQQRLAIEKQAEALKARETQLREHLIAKLPVSEATGVAGRIARATIVPKIIPQADDWDKVHDYIRKNAAKNPGVWALLQRRLNDGTVKEMWEAGKDIPGIVPFQTKSVSLNKV